MAALAAGARTILRVVSAIDLKIERELLSLFASSAGELEHPRLLGGDMVALPARDLGASQHIQVLRRCIASQTS